MQEYFMGLKLAFMIQIQESQKKQTYKKEKGKNLTYFVTNNNIFMQSSLDPP